MTQQLAPTPRQDHPGSNTAEAAARARLIVNADDWGRGKDVTDRILDCFLERAVSSTSAMVFMEDSERSADLAKCNGVDTGLHLNLTTEFSSAACPARLRELQGRLSRFLRASSFCSALYHPGLSGTFEYVVRAQLDEYQRLYGEPASRLDGHHHMHLCANVQFQKLLPAGTTVRRNFSFAPGEKSALNRLYRRWQDRRLAKRHRVADFFFSLQPLDRPERLEKIVALASRFSVEVETHPVNRDEYAFLISGTLARQAGNPGIARSYALV